MDIRSVLQELICPVCGALHGADSVPLSLEANNVPIHGLLRHAEFVSKNWRRIGPALYERKKVIEPSGDRKRPFIPHS
jgi:hypothetical protein